MQKVIRRHTLQPVELTDKIEDGFFSREDAFYEIIMTNDEGSKMYEKKFLKFDEHAMLDKINQLVPMLQEEWCIDVLINEGGHYSEQIMTISKRNDKILTFSDEDDKPLSLPYTQE